MHGYFFTLEWRGDESLWRGGPPVHITIATARVQSVLLSDGIARLLRMLFYQQTPDVAINAKLAIKECLWSVNRHSNQFNTLVTLPAENHIQPEQCPL
ncbi:hypothetical protein BBBOND_0306060 [Babesia bigemina]|uniref:Uncharacterized protein n=1 Tax=Babesia bigemina TaxID=5866 RepID=A0A061D9Q0_BABBI|nr:hypothetical protein BBBOND_0306060 [Babesia bigemina]CDR96702.1 hypothetical protein BBBOND_0306060 [Babesia bigemina]|eukprot:XP_012768888.1 hypothetical protein BBBOND_0306060 [Babesia bigemina]